MDLKQKHLPILRAVVFSVATGACIVLSGCYGHYENRAEGNLETAKSFEADEFEESKTLFESAVAKLKEGQNFQGAGEGSPARAAVKESAELAEQAADAARTRYAAKVLAEAEKAIQIARINEGASENQQLFSRAEEKLNSAREQNQEQKYDASIKQSREAIQDVNQLLARLKNEAENRISVLTQRVQELDRAKAEQYNPEPLARGRQSIVDITKKVEEERDYKQGILLATTAINETEQATIESKKRNSEDQLRVLEGKIAEAIAEEATQHVPEELNRVQDRLEGLVASYYERQYDTLLSSADALQPRADELITMARIEATKDRMRQLTEGIQRLIDQNVEEYLPGRIEAMRTQLAKSQTEFDNNNFQGAKFEASEGLVEQDRIVTTFDNLTGQRLQEATQAFQAARNTYTRMDQIFGAGQGAVDSRLETRYQIRSQELATNLNGAYNVINTATQNRGAKEFMKSIEQAIDARQTAEAVSRGSFRLTTENALLGIQDQISFLERNGARTLAAQELNAVQNLVEETQKLLTAGEERRAAEMAAKSRAYLESVRQELAREAQNQTGEAERLIQRLEGGAAPTPASGGSNVLPRQMPYGEAPGGAVGNNKEDLLANLPGPEVAAELNATTKIYAQTKVGNPTNSSGYTGAVGGAPASPGYYTNRSVPNGTFMTMGNPTNIQLNTGERVGATIGTRSEPVVVQTESNGSYSASSTQAYEGPTAPGPFIAVGDTAGGVPVVQLDSPSANLSTGDSIVASVRMKVDEILSDNQRAKDIEDYQPQAIELARMKLGDASSAIRSEDYTRANEYALEAQRIIFEADRAAAKAAAEKNLKDAADRINLANAGGSIMFAPAELNESMRLYKQGQNFMSSGDYHEARKLSSRALAAAEDSRLYNVTKARDLTALSTRYGGYKVSHPAMAESERLASIADDMLSDPSTAAQGQMVAQEAVTLAQIALDSARDFTYQERLDNIYKALNTALRAGANYFNVAEIKRLLAELAVARDEYCTRNFDAVELKLKDVEARLARVIETTPLVLEQNLIEVTEKLNALVDAGAEHWQAQEVDNVKSLMNYSVIDFRKHDYGSSYNNIRRAMQLTDRIEARLQEQVYYDAITELFAQLDKAFHEFNIPWYYDRAFLKKLVTVENGQPAAVQLSYMMNPNEFKDAIIDIYLRTIHLKPPKGHEGTHNEVILAVKYAKVAAENFQKLYIMDQVAMPDAYDILDTGYNQLIRARNLRSEIAVRIIEPEARAKVIHADKIVNF